MQCLIGLGSPSFRGIGLSAGTPSAVGAASAVNGLQAYACLVSAARAAGVGMSRMPTVPLNSPPMYSRVPCPGRIGFGPYRFGLLVVPLPLATYSRPSAGLWRTDVGYQPVGMNPRGTAFFGSPTLN